MIPCVSQVTSPHIISHSKPQPRGSAEQKINHETNISHSPPYGKTNYASTRYQSETLLSRQSGLKQVVKRRNQCLKHATMQDFMGRLEGPFRGSFGAIGAILEYIWGTILDLQLGTAKLEISSTCLSNQQQRWSTTSLPQSPTLQLQSTSAKTNSRVCPPFLTTRHLNCY